MLKKRGIAMARVTIKQLEAATRRINNRLGMNTEPHSDGKWNIGTYFLSFAYGKASLLRVANEAGGSDNVFGYHTKRELYGKITAYLASLYGIGEE